MRRGGGMGQLDSPGPREASEDPACHVNQYALQARVMGLYERGNVVWMTHNKHVYVGYELTR